jgi:hypothetical protein
VSVYGYVGYRYDEDKIQKFWMNVPVRIGTREIERVVDVGCITGWCIGAVIQCIPNLIAKLEDIVWLVMWIGNIRNIESFTPGVDAYDGITRNLVKGEEALVM